jgi:hypothetical protein
MVLKLMVPALVGAALLLTGATAGADEYRPDEFLGLDLSKAVLSPTPLGPPTQFAPVAVEAKSDVARGSEVNWARDELKAEPKKVTAENVRVTHPHQITHVASARPKGSARVRLTRRHSPLDAQAMDTRIQTWPCKSGGGICNWKR